MDFFDYIKENKLLILISSILINIVLISLLLFFSFTKKDNDINNNNVPFVETSENNLNVTDEFYVEIKGAVKNPGVYKLNSRNIINDLIKMAGGLNKNAYTKNINLSKSVSKELVVYIYTKDEYKKNNKVVYITKELPCECSSYDISNCLDNNKSEIISSDKDTIFENNESINNNSSLININTASKEELQSLTGIGESKANDIIDYRNKNGLFKNIEEITNVSGIGKALYEKIKDSITI